MPWNYWSFIDVRDVARAHILAAEQPHTIGNRYTVANSGTAELRQVGEWLQARWCPNDLWASCNFLQVLSAPCCAHLSSLLRMRLSSAPAAAAFEESCYCMQPALTSLLDGM